MLCEAAHGQIVYGCRLKVDYRCNLNHQCQLASTMFHLQATEDTSSDEKGSCIEACAELTNIRSNLFGIRFGP